MKLKFSIGVLSVFFWSTLYSVSKTMDITNICSSPPTTNLPKITNFNTILANAYQGAFHINAGIQQHKQYTGVSYYGAYSYGGDPNSSAAFSFAPSENDEIRFFLSGFGGGFNNDDISSNSGGGIESITEYSIAKSDLSKAVGSRANYVDATRQQDWLGVFDPSLNLFETTNGAHIITNLYYHKATDYLYVLTERQYPSTPPRDNMLRIKHPKNLKKEHIEGYYQVGIPGELDKGSHVASWITDIPSEWQTSLNGKHVFGGGASFSILDRLPAGPTLFTGNLDTVSITNGEIAVNRLMDFDDKPGQQMGAYLHGSPNDWYSYEMYNCDRSSGTSCAEEITYAENITPWINDWWTVLSYASQGFIIPNTSTYVVIGTLQGKEKGSGYKAVSNWRNDCGGPCRIDGDDYYNYYWLFDLNEILNADKPYKIFPYEYGTLNFLDPFLNKEGRRASILNASFDLSTGRLAIIMQETGGNRTPTNDALIFQQDSWMENTTLSTTLSIDNVATISSAINKTYTINYSNLYPSQNQLTITSNTTTTEKIYLTVYDIEGRLLISKNLKLANSVTLNLDELTSGMYILKIINESNTFMRTKKIVIN